MKPAWLVLAVGAFCLLVSAAAVVISLLVPILNAPHADFEEAVPFLVGGGCCSAVSLLIVLAGIMLLVLSRKE